MSKQNYGSNRRPGSFRRKIPAALVAVFGCEEVTKSVRRLPGASDETKCRFLAAATSPAGKDRGWAGGGCQSHLRVVRKDISTCRTTVDSGWIAADLPAARASLDCGKRKSRWIRGQPTADRARIPAHRPIFHVEGGAALPLDEDAVVPADVDDIAA